MDCGRWWRWRVIDNGEVYDGNDFVMRKLGVTSDEEWEVENDRRGTRYSGTVPGASPFPSPSRDPFSEA
jgi:hypothetical protein